MKFYHLIKFLRVISAVITILLVSVIFFDIYSFFSPSAARYAALTQFVPSFLSFVSQPSFIFSSFFIVIILTLLSGRIYCSFFCPLGIFQDIINRVRFLFRRKHNFSYTQQNEFMRYSILAAVIISFITGGTSVLMWLDPFSIYGRFSSVVLSPIITFINNRTASILSDFNIYSVHYKELKYAGFSMLITAAAMIIFISVLAAFKGRFYCNTFCPVGTLLGFISNFSFFKIAIDETACIHCGRCEKICKSSCIDYSEMYIDFSRCVSCFNCLKSCPSKGIRIIPAYIEKDETEEDIIVKEQLRSYRENVRINRITFLSGMIMLPSILYPQTPVKKQQLYYQDRSKQKDYKKKNFTSPPGSRDIESFNDSCTACSLCITRCPSTVLQPAVLQYGLSGITQPFLDFNSGYCNYDCTICGETCPTGAISRVSVAEKHLIQTGKSLFIKENCITYTNGTDCGACSEHCPTKAVKMVPFREKLVIPEVNQEICIGCGACEHVCPVRPVKAIYVEGNRVHEKANLPKKEKKIEIKKDTRKDDFPF